MEDAIPVDEYVRLLRAPAALDALVDREIPLVVIDLDDSGASDRGDPPDSGTAVPCVVVGVTDDPIRPRAANDLVDVILHRDDRATLQRINTGVRATPRAATALALLVRGVTRRSVADGLVAESAVYSMLQGGPEFAAWRGAHPPVARADRARPAVRVERRDDVLQVTLARPEVRNALNARMRDELYEALSIAVADATLRVVVEGDGPSFCAGGDLDEFGSRPDPPHAHVLRLRRSVGLLLARISDRVEVHVHGACRGSGVELPAFADRVTAATDTTFGLPEVALGLIPGAGGTVSISRRIGRWRTAQLALSGEVIDAATAHAWGLVDDLLL